MSRRSNRSVATSDMADSDERKERALRKAEDALWQLPRSLEGIKRQDFNPVGLALQMMDSSSLGKSHDEFRFYYEQLNESLDGIVNEYYGGFNDSILTFSGLHDKIHDASMSVGHIKNNLQRVRRMITEERGSMDQLYTKSNQLGAIVTILNRIEEVKRLPDEMSGYTTDKKFLTAAGKLVQDMQFVFDPELNAIEALSGLRAQLEKEKANLLHKIIDELHSHIYLKSPYCERKMGIEGEDDFEEASSDTAGNETATGPKLSTKNGGGSALSRRKMRISRKNKKLADASDDSNDGNPEADSFAYVEMLIESLVTLENTNEAMQEVKSSISLELARLIDGVVSEVEERNRALIFKSKTGDQQDEYFSQDTDREVLFDFARILFARLETVLEYHDYVLDVVSSLDRRDRYSLTAPTSVAERRHRTHPYTINDVWHAIKDEVLSLLKVYIIPEDAPTSGNIDISLGGNSMKTGVSDLFHMEKNANIDETVDSLYSQIESHFHELTISIPKKSKDTSSPAVIDEYADHQHGLQHRMLAEPSIEHAPTLLGMALSFTKRVSAYLVPATGIASPTAVISPSVRRSIIGDLSPTGPLSPSHLAAAGDDDPDEFLQTFFKKTFLPRAEARSMQLFGAVTSASDAFDIDMNTYFGGRPIFRGAAAIVPLLHSFGTLLNDLNMFRGENWSILLQLLSKYYEQCEGLFRETVRSPENQMYTSVKWSENAEMKYVFDKRLKQRNELAQRLFQADYEKEIRQEEILKTERSLNPYELIFDVKRLVCLAQLHQTLEWMLIQLNRISTDRTKVLSNHDGATATALLKRHEADKSKVVSRYTALSVQCLMVLRIEVHAHCIHYLDLATREGNYNLQSEAVEPDPYIQALNADISTIEDKMEGCLPSDKLNTVFGGISVLMAHILMTNTRYIKQFNDAGSRKMIRNILALQQNLTNIALPEESGLDKARRFYEMYELGADGVLKYIAEHGVTFTFEEYRRLIGFIYMGRGQTGDPGSGRATNLTEAKLNEEYEVHIRRLRELLSQSQPGFSALGPNMTKAPPSAARSATMPVKV
ncbi:exocyst subunit [Coemansia sp. RSA 1813]|nr:exocyst subunit [Coemansia sp. RSA 1646]KAJ2092958.1 exocyst subunit [Coemansia sp. RSA 986]KAJ2570549.1 exocyst subunit [Coemansia sp. RSA 1813]